MWRRQSIVGPAHVTSWSRGKTGRGYQGQNKAACERVHSCSNHQGSGTTHTPRRSSGTEEAGKRWGGCGMHMYAPGGPQRPHHQCSSCWGSTVEAGRDQTGLGPRAAVMRDWAQREGWCRGQATLGSPHNHTKVSKVPLAWAVGVFCVIVPIFIIIVGVGAAVAVTVVVSLCLYF